MKAGAYRLLGVILAAAGLASGGAMPAQAAPNLVANGGFETGDLAGWTQSGNTDFSDVFCPGPGPLVYEGDCAAFFGPIGSPGGISQVISGLTVGDPYTLTFAFQPDGGITSSFAVSFGGVTLLSLANPAFGPYSLYTFRGVFAATSETLAFSFRDDQGFLFLDAVSLTVPEPATMGLLGAGLMGLFFSRRRKAG